MKVSRLCSAILAVCMILSVFNITIVTNAASTTNNLNTAKGSIIFEAEDMIYNTTYLKLTEDELASGGKSLAVTKEDKTVPAASAAADIDLSFTADVTDNYYVWIRATATQGSVANSIFMSVGGGNYEYTQINGEPNEYKWTRIATVRVNKGAVGSVRLIHRQMYGIKYDQFVITNDGLFIPSGIVTEIGESDFTLPDGVYNTPSVTPPPGHPRLYFTAADINTLKANLTASSNSRAYSRFMTCVNTNSTGVLGTNNGGGNYDATIMEIAQAKAYYYALYKDAKIGEQAITMAKNILSSADFAGNSLVQRVCGQAIMICSQVYDWCYDLLDEDEKKEIIRGCESLAMDMSVGYPPKSLSAITGHGSEGQILQHLLSLAIATYNERPDIYNYVAGRIFDEFIEPRNYWYQSHSYHQGSAYTSARFINDVYAQFIYKRMCGYELFNAEDMRYVAYEQVYATRPDGQLFRMGDDYSEYSLSKRSNWNTHTILYFYAANLFNDPYLLSRYLASYPNYNGFSAGDGSYTATMHLIVNNPSLTSKSVAELDKTKYFASPNGMMIARTGWDYNSYNPNQVDDVVALMKIGERWAANHNHLDMGHFQLYYKGILASDSGFYDSYGNSHDKGYHKSSIAHNIVTVYDPNEAGKSWYGYGNDGGYRVPVDGGEPTVMSDWMNDEYSVATVLAHAFGPDEKAPQYSYIKGDLTDSYTDKVSESQRSMLFMPLDDKDHPAAFIVFDKITSSNASFKKSWLLHMQEEPVVSGNKTIVTRTTNGTDAVYNGRMVNETLLPKNPVITKIGGNGKQFWINGTNLPVQTTIVDRMPAEPGWGRVEISPSVSAKTDVFLNVMTVSDANTTAADITSRMIEGELYAGAVFADKAAIFMRSLDRNSADFSFTITESGQRDVFVGGVKEGKWFVTDANDNIVAITEASKDGGELYFTVPGSGTYKVSTFNTQTGLGAHISSATVSGSLTGGSTVTVTAQISSINEARAMAAVYNASGNLVEFKRQPYNGMGTYTFRLDLPDNFDKSTYKIKVFVTRDDSISPLCKPFDVNM